MRNELAKQIGERKKFRAVFDRIGKKINYRGYSEETILLKNIVDVDANKLVADHVWFAYTKGFERALLHLGDKIEFTARVKEYKKGYVNPLFKVNNATKDVKLSNPTKIKRMASLKT